MRAALPWSEPAGKLEEGGGVMAGDGEGGVDEGVGLDERSVQIDAERRKGGDVECGGRSGQK